MKLYQRLILIFCLAVGGQLASAQAVKSDKPKFEIQNIRSKYKEFDDISPFFVNNSTESAFVRVDCGKAVSILAFDKADKKWNLITTNLNCGDDFSTGTGLEVKPGERLKLNFSWGIAWEGFKMYGLKKQKFKLAAYYRTPSMKTLEFVESRVFEYSIKKEPFFVTPIGKGRLE